MMDKDGKPVKQGDPGGIVKLALSCIKRSPTIDQWIQTPRNTSSSSKNPMMSFNGPLNLQIDYIVKVTGIQYITL